jgi:hypothetical protein
MFTTNGMMDALSQAAEIDVSEKAEVDVEVNDEIKGRVCIPAVLNLHFIVWKRCEFCSEIALK